MMQRFVAASVTVLLGATLAACTSAPITGTGAPAPSSASSASPSPTDTFVLRGEDVCRVFDDAALKTLDITAPTRTPDPADTAPICVFPSADIAMNGSVAVQIFPDTSLQQWLRGSDTVYDTEVDGLPAASAARDGLGCSLAVELGGGVLDVGGSGTADDCRYLVPTATLAVTGLRAAR